MTDTIRQNLQSRSTGNCPAWEMLFTSGGTLDGNTDSRRGPSRQSHRSDWTRAKGPHLSLATNFGREQTLETLKGSKGTVLLFLPLRRLVSLLQGQ